MKIESFSLMMFAGVQIFQPWYKLYPVYRLSKYYKIVEKSLSDAQDYVKRVGQQQKSNSNNVQPIHIQLKCFAPNTDFG